ncbi:MAG: winged helix-turn-helix domain-containing protein [Deltaproteobacteria bacterium]|nr:winged helix-turn-helix domain-containing protein [Deltaproteobacteria bacterium]
MRKYVTDPRKLLSEGQLIVNSTDDAKFQHKVEMVNLVLAGLTPSFLSGHTADSKNAVTLWVKKADEQGFDSLRAKKQPGRPAKLSANELEEIKTLLTMDSPKESGCNVWDGISLSNYIFKTYSVKLGVRQCQRLLRNLGFSLVRPQTFPCKGSGDSSEREEFKKN